MYINVYQCLVLFLAGPRREMDCLSDSQDVDNSTYVTQVMQEVYVTS